MAFGLLDLSIVTDQLVKYLQEAYDNSRIWIENRVDGRDPGQLVSINFSGDAPDVIRVKEKCECSVYLFHVTPDAFHRNTFPLGGPPRRTHEQPFALTLHYLLSSHAGSYLEEQQAMSIALKCLHEHAIAHATVPLGGRDQEFTMTLEPESVDSIARLWQAMATPLRLSSVFRVSVIFIEPQEPPPRVIKPVIRPEVTAIATGLVARGLAKVTSTQTGLVTLRGIGLDAAALVLRVDAVTFTRTLADPPAPGSFHVVDPMRIDLQLPGPVTPGTLLLDLRFDPNESPMRVEVTVP